MKVSGFASASSRRLVIAFGVAAAMVGATAAGLVAQGAAPAQGAAAPAPPDQLKFTTGTGAMIWQVKPEATADFEGFWAAIKTKFSGSMDADQKALGDGLKIYKIDASTPGGPIQYLVLADPAPKTISYNPSPSLLYDSKLFSADEAKALFTKLQNAIAGGINPLPLVKIQ
jgi:hypothetical protein